MSSKLIPKKCPYCKMDFAENPISSSGFWEDEVYYSFSIHACVHCQRQVACILEHDKSGGETRLVHCAPPEIPDIKIPSFIKDLSPNAYEAYRQSLEALSSGLPMLVGAGLRIALEWLVTDYLVAFKGMTLSDVEKLKLHARIEKMCEESMYMKTCATLIRVFGNDTIHTINKMHIPQEEAFLAFENLCMLINSEKQIRDANFFFNQQATT